MGPIEGPVYRVKPRDPASIVAGHWYYGLDCPSCARRFAVLDNPAASQQRLCFAGVGQFRVACPWCGLDGAYLLDAMAPYRAG